MCHNLNILVIIFGNCRCLKPSVLCIHYPYQMLFTIIYANLSSVVLCHILVNGRINHVVFYTQSKNLSCFLISALK